METIKLCVQGNKKNLLDRGEAVDGQGVGGAAFEHDLLDLADVQPRRCNLGGADQLGRGGDHMNVVPRGEQVLHHLRGEHRGGTQAGSGNGTEAIRRERRAPPHPCAPGR